jgi:hypothetical protein
MLENCFSQSTKNMPNKLEHLLLTSPSGLILSNKAKSLPQRVTPLRLRPYSQLFYKPCHILTKNHKQHKKFNNIGPRVHSGFHYDHDLLQRWKGQLRLERAAEQVPVCRGVPPGAKAYKTFVLGDFRNKLECLSMATLSSLV